MGSPGSFRLFLSRPPNRQGVRAWRRISPPTPISRPSSTGSSGSARRRSSRSTTSSRTRGLLNEVIVRYRGAPAMFGASAPDTGNMEILAAYGTEEQKKRWLEPLLHQDMFSAFSMTEPQGGSDPDLFKTHAVQDGDEWVINGEKWFTSAGRVADLLFVMCTNGMFVVPRATPGVEIMPEPRNHNHIVYRDVRAPADHVLGPENGAQVLAQRRLGGG